MKRVWQSLRGQGATVGQLLAGATESHTRSHQLGKLRFFAAGCGADLGERHGHGLLGLGCIHCESTLFPVRSGTLVVRCEVLREGSPGPATVLARWACNHVGVGHTGSP